MDIKKLQDQLNKLPKEEKQTIEQIAKLNDIEMEEVVGGLSDRAKSILTMIGAAAIATAAVAGTGAAVGYNKGYSKGHSEGVISGAKAVRDIQKKAEKQ